MIDRLSPSQRPDDRPAGFQRWRNLLFLHWELPAAAIQATLPEGLTLDTFEGRAFVGVVPFTMRDVTPWWAPSVPGISTFHELNVRTYVHAGGVPGVWFYSLDAAGTVAVLAARAGWDLPYFRASMRLDIEGSDVRYTSRRLFPGPKPANLSTHFTIGEPLSAPAPGTLEHFQVERYVLFARGKGGRLRTGKVHHRPYPLHAARVETIEENLVVTAGLPAPQGSPHALYSPGVDVDVFSLRPI